MKRVLLDHCVPRRVLHALAGYDATTAYRQGWSELKNGALFSAAEANGFDVLITADKNLRYQQQLTERLIAVIELPTNSLPDLLSHFTAIADAVERIRPSEYFELTFC
jgi:hypothetical protein